MSLISIRLNDSLLHETKAKAQILHISQTEYIRRAIEHMNEEITKEEHRQKLMLVSRRVREHSMRVNHEFDEIEHDPEN
jgi:hypothetical protein